LRVLLIKYETNKLFNTLNQLDLTSEETVTIKKQLSQNSIKIGEWEKSTFGEIQTYYDDAYLKIVEARLNRKKHLIKGLNKISEAIRIYERVEYLLSERLEIVQEDIELTEEDAMVREKEIKLYDNCTKSLNATIKLQEEVEYALDQLKEKGIQREDLKKISDLTQEYDVNLYDIIVDTFRNDEVTKGAIIETLKTIDGIFDEYDKWKDIDLKVF
ncbi:MAG: hypothetical protein ACFFG0_56980, partial [Candidatus Thorarchaeota archaeon]